MYFQHTSYSFQEQWRIYVTASPEKHSADVIEHHSHFSIQNNGESLLSPNVTMDNVRDVMEKIH
jgi:hypothetical protein